MLPSPLEAAHLAVAIRAHREAMRRSLNPCPRRLRELEEACRLRAREGTEGQPLAQLERSVDPHRMTLLLDTRDVADVLRVSERTVKTLIRNGDLRSVQIGAARRVHVDDLEGYLERLRDDEREGSAA